MIYNKVCNSLGKGGDFHVDFNSHYKIFMEFKAYFAHLTTLCAKNICYF